jgi:hypothetical protein
MKIRSQVRHTAPDAVLERRLGKTELVAHQLSSRGGVLRAA